ncbi:hypothetical protein [Breoghania sp.]|uniref:hypothetical protein n=1 Tax=Breoghania sp. TaxID=2065378 RepID=UPI002AA9307A|nr:hypothetical protein [Breoghania sp.]
MDVICNVGYSESMRSWLVALLIIVFTGVHTAAAFTGMHESTLVAPSAIAHSASGHSADLSDGGKMLASHLMKCCDTSGKAGKAVKKSACAIDCLTFHVDVIAFVFPKTTELEVHPLPRFHGSRTTLHRRPPRRV